MSDEKRYRGMPHTAYALAFVAGGVEASLSILASDGTVALIFAGGSAACVAFGLYVRPEVLRSRKGWAEYYAVCDAAPDNFTARLQALDAIRRPAEASVAVEEPARG